MDPANPPQFDLAVLGVGYVGTALCRLAWERAWSVYGVSRGAARPGFPADVPYVSRNLLSAGLGDLPAARVAVLTFPLPEGAHARVFAALLSERFGRVVYLSTTGLYAENSGLAVDEGSAVRKEHERLAGEQAILEQGGTSLRLAGIYGPERSPMRWIRTGTLGNTDAWLNLIHRDDLAEAILEMLVHRHLPPIVQCSDGRPLRRRQLFDLYRELHPDEAPRPPQPSEDLGKMVLNDRLAGLLPPSFRFRDSLQTIRNEWRPTDGPEGAR